MKKEVSSFLIGIFITLFIVIGAGLAIFAALRMNRPGPVAPTVPQSKPQAAEISKCQLAFTVAALPVLKCDSVKIDPIETKVGSGDKRTLTVSGSGGQSPYTYSWTLTSDGTNNGTLSSTTGQTITWTAPANLSTKSQTWTIVGSVSDGKDTATNDNCKVALSYTFNPSCNSTCENSAGCPNDMACSNGRCRNPSCVNSADCKCPPPPKVCNDTCTVKEECSSGMTCAGGRCRNIACITAESCVCPTPVIYTPAPVTPKPPAVVATHMACRNRACVSVSGAGTDTCTSDVSCQPTVVTQPIPQSGVEMPTIMAIIGGIGLVIVGLLVL